LVVHVYSTEENFAYLVVVCHGDKHFVYLVVRWHQDKKKLSRHYLAFGLTFAYLGII
jgi:hypothetical protein